MSKIRIENKRVFSFLVVCIVVGFVLTVCDFGGLVLLSDKAPDRIALVISILAASLFAVTSILADPINITKSNWRMAWDDAKEIQNQLVRLAFLFVLYLLVLLMIALSDVVACDFRTDEGCLCAVYRYSFGFTLSCAILISFALPFMVNQIHTSKMDKMITFQKENPGKQN